MQFLAGTVMNLPGGIHPDIAPPTTLIGLGVAAIAGLGVLVLGVIVVAVIVIRAIKKRS
jgi:hypothetical protein